MTLRVMMFDLGPEFQSTPDLSAPSVRLPYMFLHDPQIEAQSIVKQ